eukprot:2406921-Rhodomonas_salina.1
MQPHHSKCAAQERGFVTCISVTLSPPLSPSSLASTSRSSPQLLYCSTAHVSTAAQHTPVLQHSIRHYWTWRSGSVACFTREGGAHSRSTIGAAANGPVSNTCTLYVSTGHRIAPA